ncbi:MAG: helix-turn-helix domain-containing protein [Ferrovum sp.]|nr:helix-turn-helix domain-containing protein [Ferrovum sp.]
MDEWDIDEVAARFAEAAETGRRLPPARVQGYFNVWPAFARDQWETLALEEPEYRCLPPSPAAIDRMLEAMRWMLWLEVEQRHLLWMRAGQYDWQEIARRFGCCRTTAWRRWKIAINQVALQLNSEKTSKQKGHAG